MHKRTYRSKSQSNSGMHQKFLTTLGLIAVLLFFVACEKNNGDQYGPTIQLVASPGIISADTTIAVGQLMTFNIVAGNGSSNITNIIAIREGGIGTSQRAFDTSMNTPQLNFTKTFTKNLAKKEYWTFIIRDRNRLSDSVSVLITLDTTAGYGPVIYYESLIMSAQNEPDPGSFFSFMSEVSYTLDAASQHQELIDLTYYYGPEERTMASPGANIEDDIFNPSPTGWETRRTTRYIAIDLPPGAFDDAQNDSLLIASYTEGEGKRKAKHLEPESTYSFQTQDLKLGIFRVKDVEGTDAGLITLDIIIQNIE